MMTIHEFTSLIQQMKNRAVPRRLVFLWLRDRKQLDKIVDGIEIQRCDLAFPYGDNVVEELPSGDSRKILEGLMKEICVNYEKKRCEPSALIIENAILLARYGCDLSPIFRFGISPRSAVILAFPLESRRQLPLNTEKWVKRNTHAIVIQVAKQLGEPGCIIEA